MIPCVNRGNGGGTELGRAMGWAVMTECSWAGLGDISDLQRMNGKGVRTPTADPEEADSTGLGLT